MCVHASCLKYLFVGALGLKSVPSIGDGSHSWQGCQVESFADILIDSVYKAQEVAIDFH